MASWESYEVTRSLYYKHCYRNEIKDEAGRPKSRKRPIAYLIGPVPFVSLKFVDGLPLGTKRTRPFGQCSSDTY